MLVLVAWIGVVIGTILGFLLCSTLSANNDPEIQVTCENCCYKDTEQCPFAHFIPDIATGVSAERKTDTDNDFYCKKAKYEPDEPRKPKNL